MKTLREFPESHCNRDKRSNCGKSIFAGRMDQERLNAFGLENAGIEQLIKRFES